VKNLLCKTKPRNTRPTSTVPDGPVVGAVFVLRRAILSAGRDDVRRLLAELAYLRRLARRQLPRAA